MPPKAPKEQKTEHLRFKVNGRTYKLLNLEELEFWEVEFIEENCGGTPVHELDIRRARALRSLLFVSMQRAGSDISFDELGEIKYDDVEQVKEEAAKGGRPTRRSSKSDQSGTSE